MPLYTMHKLPHRVCASTCWCFRVVDDAQKSHCWKSNEYPRCLPPSCLKRSLIHWVVTLNYLGTIAYANREASRSHPSMSVILTTNLMPCANSILRFHSQLTERKSLYYVISSCRFLRPTDILCKHALVMESGVTAQLFKPKCFLNLSSQQ